MTNAQSASTSAKCDLPEQIRQVPAQAFPKSCRLLKRADFRKVYDQGSRLASSCFVAFCLRGPADAPSQVGFTTTRALGKAVQRNRMRRRLRETIRRRLSELSPGWQIVWNLRRASLSAPQAQLESEVEKVFQRCKD